jgi:hypothetical protein
VEGRPRGRLRLEPDRRHVPVRRLTTAEAEHLGFAGPLQLSRVHVGRFGWFRPTPTYVVETHRGEVRMEGSADELAVYGIGPEPSPPTSPA